MDEILHIELDHGYMNININMPGFFPCEKARIRKLCKVIRGCWKNDFDELHKKMLDYCNAQLPTLEEWAASAGKMAAEEYQQWKDAGRICESGKWPSGVMLRKDELKKQKELTKSYKNSYLGHLKFYEQSKKSLEKYKANIKTLEEV